MIRQAISCDICGTEKRQTNHWFVAYEHAGELRVSGWSSRYRFRAGSKHLCGQTCLHKLVDEFMAKSIAVRAQHTSDDLEPVPHSVPPLTDAILTSSVACPDFESSARLLPALPSIPPRPQPRPQPELLTLPTRTPPDEVTPPPAEPTPFSSRTWRAEAWKRERARGLHAGHQ